MLFEFFDWMIRKKTNSMCRPRPPLLFFYETNQCSLYIINLKIKNKHTNDGPHISTTIFIIGQKFDSKFTYKTS